MPSKIKCKNCDKPIYFDSLIVGGSLECPNCFDLNPTEEKNIESVSDEEYKSNCHNSEPKQYKNSVASVQNDTQGLNENNGRYPALSTVSTIYKILAILTGGVAIVALLFGLSMINGYGTKEMGYLLITYSILAGVFGVVCLLAISEGIKLFIDIENNTKKQNILLGRLINKTN